MPGEWVFQLAVADDESNPFNQQLPPSGEGQLGEVRHQMRRGLDFEPEVLFRTEGPKTLTVRRGTDDPNPVSFEIPVAAGLSGEVPSARVALVAPDPPRSRDEVLWTFIDEISNRLRFDEFHEFVRPKVTGTPNWHGTDAYQRLREAAEEFVGIAADPLRAARRRQFRYELTESTVRGGIKRSYVSDEGTDLAQPFLRFAAPSTHPQPAAVAGGSEDKVDFPLPNVPFVELIWNYWLEEAMLVQSLNYILARFQNRRLGRGRDTLARFDLNPLLPLRSLLWGFVEDERRRLTVRRRAAEYEYQYGLQLLGRAVPPPSHVVQRRTQFVEAFHGLLNSCHGFFKERDDKTVDADAFPLLSSLREVHLVLARGAHNQFADLPLTARAEMLTMQWILAQPEMREFLGGPTMVPYEEPWMDRVDSMKTLNGWSDASVTHFFELAVTGEQIVLSIRHGRWNESSRTRNDAANWVLTWRDAIQRYIHAYRAVTGADLATTIEATMPSTLLAARLGRRALQA